jgi:hypothetical protein
MISAERRLFWTGVLSECEKSGLSLPAFSRANNVRYETLRRWRAKLAGHKKPTAELPPSGFVELLPAAMGGQSRHETGAGCGVRVLLANGIRIELASGFDASTLSRAALALGGLER